ncbi:hypothetical protein H6K91_11955 [Staphylococcus epidermidis]|nr:hypothetical protein [Staphylococcus epidermidis]
MYLLVLYIGISADIKYTIISFIIYAIGISFYIYVRRQFAPHEKVFTKTEIGFAIAIVIIAIVGIFILEV